MATSCVRRKVAGAGSILIGLIVWVAAAVGPIAALPEVALLGVPLGGMLTIGRLELRFSSGRLIAARYFEETEEVARAARRFRRHAEFPRRPNTSRKRPEPPDWGCWAKRSRPRRRSESHAKPRRLTAWLPASTDHVTPGTGASVKQSARSWQSFPASSIRIDKW